MMSSSACQVAARQRFQSVVSVYREYFVLVGPPQASITRSADALQQRVAAVSASVPMSYVSL